MMARSSKKFRFELGWDLGMLAKAQAWLETQHADMLADLTSLANQNSGSNNLPGLLQVAQWLEDWAGLEQAEFARIELPPRRFVDDAGQVQSIAAAPALRWDLRPTCQRRVLLAIHYDTVFGIDHAFQTCRMTGKDTMNGPGVADAKGGIVVLINAVRALEQFQLASDIGLTVLLNPDEEIGSPSSTDLLQKVAPEFDFGLLFEPALPTGELVSDRKGSGNFDLVVRGKSAHAGRHFDEGRNAVALLSRLMCQFHELNGQRDGMTLNVGSVHGGGPVNIVPDLAIGRFNVRVQQPQCADWIQQRLHELVVAADAEDGFSVELHGGITAPPKRICSRAQTLMQAVDSAVQDCGGAPVRWKSTGGVCDGNKLAAAGLANIDTMGPIGDGLHSTSEWVQVSSLVTKAQVIANLLSRFAAGEFSELARVRS